jgi:glycosyltransferase involved in cell wall biosynthesis
MNDVNIITITYNHEKFIKTTLDSFLMQKTNLKFKIIISDDCSTDNTPKIIEKYYKKYPNLNRNRITKILRGNIIHLHGWKFVFTENIL